MSAGGELLRGMLRGKERFWLNLLDEFLIKVGQGDEFPKMEHEEFDQISRKRILSKPI